MTFYKPNSNSLLHEIHRRRNFLTHYDLQQPGLSGHRTEKRAGTARLAQRSHHCRRRFRTAHPRTDTAIPENLTCIYIPQEEFNIDMKDYIFLGGYNLYFPDLLNQTNIIYQLFKDTIDIYNEFIKNDKSYKLMLKEQYTFDKDSYIKRVNALENITNELLLRLYYILKNCNICYDKYFNPGCFDNIKENFDNLKLEEKPTLKEVLDNEKYKAVKEYQANFEKYWAGQSRFGCTICYIIRKIRHWFKWLKNFFQLPENCKFGSKKNKEEKPTNES